MLAGEEKTVPAVVYGGPLQMWRTVEGMGEVTGRLGSDIGFANAEFAHAVA